MKNSMIVLLLCCWTLMKVQAQNKVEVNGMTFQYEIKNEQLEITLEAPTTGWLGVGFNTDNNIVGSDLLLFHIVEGKTEGLDMYVKGFGDPREDKLIGGTDDIRIISGVESAGHSKVRFSIPLQSKDQYDFKHVAGQDFWLILAYSVDDDFGHHSRMRKHIRYRLK
ncbi:MAG: DOMON domain-containing protein [Bacteroidota bacterium]